MAHLTGTPSPDVYPRVDIDVLAMPDNPEVLADPDAFRLGATQLDFLGQLVGTQPVSRLNADYLNERGLFGGTPALHQAVEEALAGHRDAEQALSLHQGMIRGQKVFDGLVEYGNGPALKEVNAVRHRERRGSVAGVELAEYRDTVRSGAVEQAQGRVVEYMHRPLKKRRKDLGPTQEERTIELTWEGFARAEGLDELVREQRLTPAQLAAGPDGLRAAAEFARMRAGQRTPLSARQRLAQPSRTTIQDRAEQLALLVDRYDRVQQDEVLGPLLERIVARANEINPDDPIFLAPSPGDSAVDEVRGHYEAPGARDRATGLPAHVGGVALGGRDPHGRARVLTTPGTPVRPASERFAEPLPTLPPPPFRRPERPPRYTDDIESPFLHLVDPGDEVRTRASTGDLDTAELHIVPTPTPEARRTPHYFDGARAQVVYDYAQIPHAQEILGALAGMSGVGLPEQIARRAGLSVAEVEGAFAELSLMSAIRIDPSGEYLLTQQNYADDLDGVYIHYPFANVLRGGLDIRDFTETTMAAINTTIWGELPLDTVYRQITANSRLRDVDDRGRFMAALNVIDALVATRRLQMVPTAAGPYLRRIDAPPQAD